MRTEREKWKEDKRKGEKVKESADTSRWGRKKRKECFCYAARLPILHVRKSTSPI
jgi:hypothetical protein